MTKKERYFCIWDILQIQSHLKFTWCSSFTFIFWYNWQTPFFCFTHVCSALAHSCLIKMLHHIIESWVLIHHGSTHASILAWIAKECASCSFPISACASDIFKRSKIKKKQLKANILIDCNHLLWTVQL